MHTATADQLFGNRRALTWTGWQFAAVMFVAAIGGCLFMSFGLGHLVGDPNRWLVSGDVWTTTNSAQYVTYGGGGYVYAANPYYSALPGFLFLLAPVVALGDHLGLMTGYPIALARPSMWLLVGPFFFVCGATVVLGVDYLADTLEISRLRRRWIAGGTALVVAIPTPGYLGHPEDLLALALAALALALLLRGRPSTAAGFLAAAILMQTWAGLLLPVFVAVSPPGARLRMFWRSALVPAALAALLLIWDFPDAYTDLIKQPMPNTGQHLPWWGLASHFTVMNLGTKQVMVTGSFTRSIAVLVAVGAGLWIRRDPTPDRVVLAAAVALFARGFFETEYWSYYLAPAAVLMVLLGARRTAFSPKRFVVATISVLLFYGHAAAFYLHVLFPPLLALAIMAASGGLCLAASFPDTGRIFLRRLSDRARPAPGARLTQDVGG